MSAPEIRKRAKAVAFPNHQGAYIKVGGVRFNYQSNKPEPLDNLCKIAPNMSADEIREKIQAFKVPNRSGAFVEIDGIISSYQFNKAINKVK